MNHSDVIVVGAGMAGLSCAVSLARRGLKVTVLEAAPRLGGRTSQFDYHGVTLDNGQHLILSNYRSLFQLPAMANKAQNRFTYYPFHWLIYDGRNAGSNPRPQCQINNQAGLAALWHQLTQAAYGSSSLINRLKLIGGFSRLIVRRPAAELRADRWLRALGQNDKLIELLWAPLCLAALNTPVQHASARVLSAVLRRVLLDARGLSLVFNRRGLGDALTEPCSNYIAERRGEVHLGQRVTGLSFSSSRAVNGVITAGGHRWSAPRVVLSIPPAPCARLLVERPAAKALVGQLNQLPTAPIQTIYLQFAESLGGRHPLIGLINHEADWLIDRQLVSQQVGLMAAVTSARICRHAVPSVLQTLENLYGALPKLLWHKTVVEKHATVQCTPAVQDLRPEARTSIDGLWLNGDWIRSTLPSTIETAVENGSSCAAQLSASYH